MSRSTLPLNGIDHRWGDRVRVDLPVQVSVHTLWQISGRLKDLSLSGALLRPDVDLRVHATIDVSLNFASLSAAHHLPIKAYVVRRQDGDVGIEWYDFAPGAVRAVLKAYQQPSQRALASVRTNLSPRR